jgi:hypothetical protein
MKDLINVLFSMSKIRSGENFSEQEACSENQTKTTKTGRKAKYSETKRQKKAITLSRRN